jgi:hypothetical protein
MSWGTKITWTWFMRESETTPGPPNGSRDLPDILGHETGGADSFCLSLCLGSSGHGVIL